MYDKETVETALEALGLGFSQREAAELAGCGRSAVSAWARGELPRSASPGASASMAREKEPEPEEDPMTERTDREKSLYEPPESGPLSGLTSDQIENMLLRAVLADLKAGGWDPASLSNAKKAELGERLRRASGLPLRLITGFLRISKSSYEYHRARLSDVDPREFFGDEIERIFREEGDCARGYRFVTAVLSSELGEPVSEKIVRDVMRERGLTVVYAKKARRYSSYAGETDERPENVPLGEDGTHDFRAGAPNEKWVSDVTEFRLPGDPRKVYLSPVIDLFDGRPVAWRAGLHPDKWLTEGSLRDACGTLRPGEHPFCHTDGGCHYRWPEWKATCAEFGIRRSMSRKGCSPDNAACEGFFGRLKNEFFYGRDWSGVTAEQFMWRLNAWMRFYREGRLKAFREDGRVVYDTIDGRRRRLGLAA